MFFLKSYAPIHMKLGMLIESDQGYEFQQDGC